MFDDLSLYPRYNAIIGTIGLPWWNIGGNHDLNFEAPDRRYCRETYKRFFGPNYYAFFYAQTLFLMLDDVDYLGADPAKPKLGGKYEGRLDERQLEFVRGVLAHTPDDTLIIVVLHIPITHRGRRRDLAEPRQQGGAVSSSSRGDAIRSASPATPTPPSTIISTPPTAGKGRRPTTITC